MNESYEAYLRYKKIIELLSKKKLNAHELCKESKIPITTVYRMLGSLDKQGVIKIKKRSNMGERVFQIYQVKKNSRLI